MKALTRSQKMMVAATFAEAGEWDTAREMTPEPECRREISWLEKTFAAVAFAEAGELDTAREMTPEPEYRREASWLEKIFAAVAFAEAGLADMAHQIMTGRPRPKTVSRKDPLADLGLQGFHLAYGYVSID